MPVGYSQAIWSPTQNQWSGRASHAPKFLIIHGTGGFSDGPSVVRWFQNPASQVSAHYVIDLDGTIYQVVSESDTAWANCCYTGDYDAFWEQYSPKDPAKKINANYVSISIEHVKPASDNSNILTAAQQAASFALVKDVCIRNGIPMKPADLNGGITGHFSMDRVNKMKCPGPYPWDKLWAFLGVTYTPDEIMYAIYPITSQYGVPQEVISTVIQAESGWNFAAQGDRQYSANGKDPTSFGLFQLHLGGQAPTGLGDNLQMLSPFFNAQYAMPGLQRGWNAYGASYDPHSLAWWEGFGSVSGHPGGLPGDATNTAEATNLLKIYGGLSLVPLNAQGEVADFADVDQFQPTKTEFACGFFSVAVAKSANKVGSNPIQTTQQMIDEAEAWYAQYDGSNDGSNMLGMSLQQEYDLLVQTGMHYQAVNLDDDTIRAWIRQGYPVMVAVAETTVYDIALGGNPYPWTPAGNHIFLLTGVKADGTVLVRDTANCTDLFNPNSLRPGPRNYDLAKLNYISATAVVLPWMPRPPAGFDPRKDTITNMIDITTPGVSAWFKDLGNGSWEVIREGKYKGLIIKGGILALYRAYGPSGLNGLTWLGLPTTLERPAPGAKNGQVEQVFEKGRIVWDTLHLLDDPAGIPANSAYTGHVDILGAEADHAALAGAQTALVAAQAQLAADKTLQAQDVTDDIALNAQIAALQAQLAAVVVPTSGVPADVQAAINSAVQQVAALQALLQPFQK